MKNKTEEPTPKRSTYIDVNTGEQASQPPEVSPELRQTIAEAREAQVADLKAQITTLVDQLEASENELSDSRAENKQLRDDLALMENAAELAAGAQSNTVHDIVDEHLRVYEAGPSAILSQMERRGPVERAGHLASIKRLADLTAEHAQKLYDLANKSEVASRMLEDTL